MDIKTIEDLIRRIDLAIEHQNKLVASLKIEGQSSKGGDVVYRFTQEQNKRFKTLRNDNNDNKSFQELVHSKKYWVVLLEEEFKLNRDYSQEIRKDRTIKLNSFYLRLGTAIGVIVVSVVTLNVLSRHFNLDVPWIFTKNNVAMSMPYAVNNHSASSSIIVEEKASYEVTEKTEE